MRPRPAVGNSVSELGVSASCLKGSWDSARITSEIVNDWVSREAAVKCEIVIAPRGAERRRGALHDAERISATPRAVRWVGIVWAHQNSLINAVEPAGHLESRLFLGKQYCN